MNDVQLPLTAMAEPTLLAREIAASARLIADEGLDWGAASNAPPATWAARALRCRATTWSRKR